MSRIVKLILLAAIAATPASLLADVIVVDDDFSAYPDGPLVPQGNWIGHANGFAVDDATDTATVTGAWLGAANTAPGSGPASTPNGTYQLTLDFSVDMSANANTDLIVFGVQDDIAMQSFPNPADDLVGKLEYNQWPNPNYTPANQTTFKFFPSFNSLSNPDGLLLPVGDLGLDMNDFDGDGTTDFQSDVIRLVWAATHTGGDNFDISVSVDNLTTGANVGGPFTYSTTEAGFGSAANLYAGIRAQNMSSVNGVTLHAVQFTAPDPVPEPQAILLLLAGLTGLAAIRRS